MKPLTKELIKVFSSSKNDERQSSTMIQDLVSMMEDGPRFVQGFIFEHDFDTHLACLCFYIKLYLRKNVRICNLNIKRVKTIVGLSRVRLSMLVRYKRF